MTSSAPRRRRLTVSTAVLIALLASLWSQAGAQAANPPLGAPPSSTPVTSVALPGTPPACADTALDANPANPGTVPACGDAGLPASNPCDVGLPESQACASRRERWANLAEQCDLDPGRNECAELAEVVVSCSPTFAAPGCGETTASYLVTCSAAPASNRHCRVAAPALRSYCRGAPGPDCVWLGPEVAANTDTSANASAAPKPSPKGPAAATTGPAGRDRLGPVMTAEPNLAGFAPGQGVEPDPARVGEADPAATLDAVAGLDVAGLEIGLPAGPVPDTAADLTAADATPPLGSPATGPAARLRLDPRAITPTDTFSQAANLDIPSSTTPSGILPNGITLRGDILSGMEIDSSIPNGTVIALGAGPDGADDRGIDNLGAVTVVMLLGGALGLAVVVVAGPAQRPPLNLLRLNLPRLALRPLSRRGGAAR